MKFFVSNEQYCVTFNTHESLVIGALNVCVSSSFKGVSAMMESVINALRAVERWNAVNRMGGRRKGKRLLVSLAEIGRGALAGISRCICICPYAYVHRSMFDMAFHQAATHAELDPSSTYNSLTLV